MKYWLGILSLIFSGLCFSDEITVGGALTGFYQQTSSNDADDERILVLDLDVNVVRGSGEWHVYIEGTSTSVDGRVSAVYGDALADAGGASDAEGQGRIQISNFEYIFKLGSGSMVVGLTYPSGFAESGDWSNDETSQFIASPFVNIPTIGSPDYAIGIGYQSDGEDSGIGWSVLLSQAQGLGDLDGSYHKLLSTWNNIFFTGEVTLELAGLDTRIGIWTNQADHDKLDGTGQDENFGANISIAKTFDKHRLLLRIGFANEDVSDVARTVGVTYQYFGDSLSAGAAYMINFASDEIDAAGKDDSSFAEVYVNYQLLESLYVTGSLLRLTDTDLGLSGLDDSSAYIATIRLSYEF